MKTQKLKTEKETILKIFKKLTFSKFPYLLGVLVLLSAVSFELYSHDDDDDDHDDDDDISEYLNNKRTSFPNRRPTFEVANDPLYIQECTDCHFGYSRNMLPARSWKKLMTKESLADHFGEFIELDEPDRLNLENYLVAGSAEKVRYKISRKIMKSIKSSETPIQISKIRFIKRQHREIPDKYVSQNAKVLSLSQCSACHQRAEKGIIDEDEVYIPYEMKQ